MGNINKSPDPEGRAKYLVVISLDGLSSADLKIIKELPHFKEILESGSHAREVIGIYPTLTYPIHASIITGCYVQKHGIVANTRLQPGREKPEWFWFRKEIKVPPLYDIARSAGLKVGTLLWPTAGNAKVHYNLPEIIPTKPRQSQLWLVLSHGTPLFILDILRRFGRLLKGIKRCNLDNFVAASASYLIRFKKPDLLLIHLLDLDATRHRSGFQSAEAKRVLKEQDVRLGQIMKAARDSGIFRETAFIILGDHAYLDVHHRININTALHHAGLISLDGRGKLSRWKAWANACDGSAQITLKDRDSKSDRDCTFKALMELKNNPHAGIEAVFDRKQILEMRLGDSIDFILEAKEGYCFTASSGKKLIEPAKTDHRAAHGYLPDRKGYSSLFLASGAGIKKGVVLHSINIVDVGPTLAALLGLTLPEADGRILTEILKFKPQQKEKESL